MSVRFFTDYMKEQMAEIARHKWIMSEKAGKDVGWDEAIKDFVACGHARDFHDSYFRRSNITSIDSEMNEVLRGDSCLVLEFKAVAHNYENGKEATLEDGIVKYCFGKKKDCQYRKEISSGLRQCERKYELANH